MDDDVQGGDVQRGDVGRGGAMRTGALHYAFGGAFLRLAWTEFGSPDAPPVLCVHGLTRLGRDFDALGMALSDRWRVVCPDLPGRGDSDRFADPMAYNPVSYLTPLSHLLAVLGRPVVWVGTSLGGICGMLAAAMPGAPITRMVLNDVGPFIPQAALERIATYLATEMEFDDQPALEAYLRRIHAPFGRLTDAQWAHLAAISSRPLDGVRVRLHYDPAIAVPMRTGKQPPEAVDLWAVWRQIHIPMLAIRGEHSDLLLPDTLAQMRADGAATHEVDDAGHAPALMDDPTIAVIAAFLAG